MYEMLFESLTDLLKVFFVESQLLHISNSSSTGHYVTIWIKNYSLRKWINSEFLLYTAVLIVFYCTSTIWKPFSFKVFYIVEVS